MTTTCKTGEDFAVEFMNEMSTFRKIVKEKKMSFKKDNAF